MESEAFSWDLVLVSDWTDQLSLGLHCNDTIITGRNWAVDMLRSVYDKSATLCSFIFQFYVAKFLSLSLRGLDYNTMTLRVVQ